MTEKTKNLNPVVVFVTKAISALKARLAKAEEANTLAAELGVSTTPTEQLVKTLQLQLAKLEAFATPSKAQYSKPSMQATTTPSARSAKAKADARRAHRRAYRKARRARLAKLRKAEEKAHQAHLQARCARRAARRAAMAKALNARARARAKARKARKAS